MQWENGSYGRGRVYTFANTNKHAWGGDPRRGFRGGRSATVVKRRAGRRSSSKGDEQAFRW